MGGASIAKLIKVQNETNTVSVNHSKTLQMEQWLRSTHVFVSETEMPKFSQANENRDRTVMGREILTSLPQICAQYAVPFQCSRSSIKLLVLIDIYRGAQVANLLVQLEYRGVT